MNVIKEIKKIDALVMPWVALVAHYSYTSLALLLPLTWNLKFDEKMKSNIRNPGIE